MSAADRVEPEPRAGFPAKYYLLYARQNWKDARLIVSVLSVGYLGFGTFQYIQFHRIDLALQFWIVALAALFLILPLVYLHYRLNYVAFRDGGIIVKTTLRRVEVPYTEVEKARTDTMQHIFDRPERSRVRSGLVKRLYRERALCVRVRDLDGYPDQLRRRLGPRTVLDRELVLPVTQPDQAYAALKDRLQRRRAQASTVSAQEGRRRRGRGRKRR